MQGFVNLLGNTFYKEINAMEIIFLITATIITVVAMAIDNRINTTGNNLPEMETNLHLTFDIVAHEIKTPATIISGNIELLKESFPENLLYNHLDEIEIAINRLENYLQRTKL